MDKTLWPAFTNLPGEKDLQFKFFVDAGNAPTLAAAPANNYIAGVVRSSQGVYLITLADACKSLLGVTVDLALNVAGVTYAVPGPSTNFGQALSVGAPTVTIFILDNTGAVANPPAANANVYVSGTITVTDLGAQ
jgi:hypothetical protein